MGCIDTTRFCALPLFHRQRNVAAARLAMHMLHHVQAWIPRRSAPLRSLRMTRTSLDPASNIVTPRGCHASNVAATKALNPCRIWGALDCDKRCRAACVVGTAPRPVLLVSRRTITRTKSSGSESSVNPIASRARTGTALSVSFHRPALESGRKCKKYILIRSLTPPR